MSEINTAGTGAILFYECQHYYLSNFSSFAVEIDGEVWSTAEHAYQAAKFYATDLRKEVLFARSAHDAKKIACKHDLRKRPDWEDEKSGLMLRILWQKFDQHEYVREKLLETRDAVLIENSPKDSYWGWGPDGAGKNMLGKIWMQIRAQAREKIKESAAW